MTTIFPPQRPGVNHLTEGGQETEIMYKFGFELPEFAMFPLLDDPRAVTEMRGMYERYLDTAERHGFGALMGGLDYRASPDWAGLIGYSPSALEEMQLRAIEFLRDVAKPYVGRIPSILFVGIVGPRGDAYGADHEITADEAEEYHSVQLATLARAGVDLVEAMTFNNVPEAGDPADLGRLMGDLAGRYPHLDVWGGCCGTWEDHLDEIARNVRAARGLAG